MWNRHGAVSTWQVKRCVYVRVWRILNQYIILNRLVLLQISQCLQHASVDYTYCRFVPWQPFESCDMCSLSCSSPHTSLCTSECGSLPWVMLEWPQLPCEGKRFRWHPVGAGKFACVNFQHLIKKHRNRNTRREANKKRLWRTLLLGDKTKRGNFKE